MSKTTKPRIIPVDEFLHRAKAKHGNKFNYENMVYVHYSVPVTIACPNHGYIEIDPRKHVDSKHGCKQCLADETGPANFVQRAMLVHGNRYSYNEMDYTTITNNVIVTCPQHGNFSLRGVGHLRGRGCKQCHPNSFKGHLPGVLYVLHSPLTGHTKVGITSRLPSLRLAAIRSESNIDFEMINTYAYDTAAQARVQEVKLLEYLAERYVRNKVKFNGYTEVYMHVNIPEFLSQIPSYIH